jgi:hypothetical protein
VPSQYRIRREPKETYVSTIEALVHVLGALEGDPRRFEGLLEPFRALIDTQIACERARHGTGSRHADKKLRPRRVYVHSLLADPSRDVVCVTGEANAWPYKSREHGKVYEDELVHWAACRLSTGETFERVVAPRHALAPRTASYVELPPSRLEAGGTLEDLLHAWRAFIRDTDVLCFWGHYAAGLFAGSGGYLPPDSVDVRAASRDLARARVGTLEEHIDRTGVEVSGLPIDGRAGRRLAQVTAIVRHMRSLAGP